MIWRDISIGILLLASPVATQAAPIGIQSFSEFQKSLVDFGCDSNGEQLNDCLHKIQYKADEYLNNVEKSVLAQVKDNPDDFAPWFRKAFPAKFGKIESSWRSWRAEDCKLIGDAVNGSGAEAKASDCLISATEQRARDLISGYDLTAVFGPVDGQP